MIGQTLGPYRILDKLGEGGMGEVYRARDTTLDRDVAIKILPPLFASDGERLARFDREAKVLASLNHPHIAAIHGLHEDHGQRFLVMELVPGEDLAARLVRGALPIDEAVVIARKIAEGLEYAHERGIIHRDLKPANVKITPDGDVKVLDFGLAKAVAADPSTSSPTSTPTMVTVTGLATAAGLILGTAAYMSPEQARGKAVDKRADNWAFGCVLYEMLVGTRPFDGETVTDVLASVVTHQPDWSKLPAGTPEAVRRLLARCLAKDPRARLRDIGEARIVLENPRALDAPAPATVPPVGRGTGWWMSAAALAALVAGLAIGRYALAPTSASARTYEFDVSLPGRTIEMGSFALSPDARRLAFVIREDSGDRVLAVRDLASAEPGTIAGTTQVEYPFWSPDGQEIAYFSTGRLYRVRLDGSAPRPITQAPDPRGGAWGPGDVILIGSGSGPIQRVSASGDGKPEAITKLAPGDDAHAWPAFLPDGKRFVFLCDSATTEGHKICLASIGGGPLTILRSGVRSQPVIDPSGRLLIGERGQLLAYPFDLDTGVLGEQSTLVASQIYPVGNQHHLAASAALGGMMAFQQGSADMNLVLLDQAGQVTRTIGQPDRYGNPRISPNGKRVSYEIFTDSAERLVWVQDLDRGVRIPMSSRERQADDTAWAPDNETLYFDSTASGKWEIYRKPVSGGGAPEGLGSATGGDFAISDVSADGRWALASGSTNGGSYDLFVRALSVPGGKWTSWTTGPAAENAGAFSPDARWVAYVSDDSSRPEVYIAPLEGGPSVHRWQISSGGGLEPRFSPDGKTLYYRTPTFDWMAVDVKATRDGIEAGTPKKRFSLPPVDLPYLRNVMDVLPDGSGFLTTRPATSQFISSAIRIRTSR